MKMNAHPNQWNDQLSIDTPELVALEFPLAGIGSRCLALIIDYLLQSVVLVLAVLALFAIAASAPAHPQTPARTPLADKWIVAILIAIPFFFQWGYFALFEAFWGGRTPGKRIMHLRVIQQNGRSISFIESLIRNFIRVVDFLPFLYVIGVVSIFVTKRNQRLGDLAAGTKRGLFVAHVRQQVLRGALGALLAARHGLLGREDLPLDLVDDLVDGRVHVLAGLVRMEVRRPRMHLDLHVVQAVVLTTERDLALHRSPQKLLHPPDLVCCVALDRFRRVHVPKRHRDVHLLASSRGVGRPSK